MNSTAREKSGNSDRWGVILLAHGAPDRLEDIPEFLLNVRGGRPLPEAAVQEIIRRYKLIGGGSPQLRLTNLQAAALDEVLNRGAGAKGRTPIPVYVGMRNWKPFIAEAVGHAKSDGVGRLLALCLAPQNSRTSVGLYRKYLMDAVGKIAPEMHIEFIESWHDNPDLIAAFQEKISRALDRAEKEAGVSVPVIFTAHSVPEKTVADGDPYDRQVKEMAAVLAGALSLKNWWVAYQSQGMTADPWIGPTVESQIDQLAAAGHRHVLIAPIGFVSDHVEILYDIDIVFREYGTSKGLGFSGANSLNNSPFFFQPLPQKIIPRIVTNSAAGQSAGIP